MIKRKTKEIETCYKCTKLIFLNFDKYVELVTYKKGEMMDKNFFHFKCWEDNFREKVQAKIKYLFQEVIGNLAGIMKKTGMTN